MAADLGLVPHAAKAHAHEIATRCARDGSPERGLPDAGGTHEAEDGPLHALHQRLHRQVLENPFLRLLEPVVVFLQNPFGLVDILVLVLVGPPGQRQDPVDVVAHDRRFRGHGRHHLELADLFLTLLRRFPGYRELLELLLQLLDLVLELVPLAQLLLDRPHLLVEVELLLRALHLLFHARTDLVLDLEYVNLGLDEAEELLEPLSRARHLENPLLVFDLQVQMRNDGVAQTRRIGDARDGRQHLRLYPLVELHVLLERRVDTADQRVRLDRHLLALIDRLDPDEEIIVDRFVIEDPRPLLAFNQDLHGPIGKLYELYDRSDRTDGVDALFVGAIGPGIALRREQKRAIALHGFLERSDRLLAADE